MMLMMNVIVNASVKKIILVTNVIDNAPQLDTEAIFYIPFNYDVSHQVLLS